MKDLSILYRQLQKWKDVYDVNFQMYGGEFNIYLSKNDIELYSMGGCETPEEALNGCLAWINKVNKPIKENG